MIELLLPLLLLGGWAIFSFSYIQKARSKPDTINQYIFDSIPSVFPTIGILCTALGITIGLWNFDTKNIQGSLPELLSGLKLAFVATVLGIAGLIGFQKWAEIVQNEIDNSPKRPKKLSDELSALEALNHSVELLKEGNKEQFQILTKTFEGQLKELTNELNNSAQKNQENNKQLINKLTSVVDTLDINDTKLLDELKKLREEQKVTSEKANKNTDLIVSAMSLNNEIIRRKFDEFSVLLQKNNTEALVTVMKNATEQFNAQMSTLINRLVQENFQELNNSVKSLNVWQKENKNQIEKLTNQFKDVSENLQVSAKTLNDVADATKTLTEEDGKLSQLVQELRNVMIEDGRFQEITNKISETIETLHDTTEAFEGTTQKLNTWVRNQMNFNEKAEILIKQLEEFRNLNGEVWNRYRAEMQKAVGIIKETSTALSSDLENVNAEFYSRLNDTLRSLDECIQRIVTNRR